MSEKEKKEAVDGFVELMSKHAVEFFTMMGLKTHIEATLKVPETGDEYIFILKKLEK